MKNNKINTKFKKGGKRNYFISLLILLTSFCNPEFDRDQMDLYNIYTALNNSTLTLSYSPNSQVFALNSYSEMIPIYTGTINSCSVSPSLPSGLNLSSTCLISGTPTVTQSTTTYTITAVGNNSTVNAEVLISVSTSSFSVTYNSNSFTYNTGTVVYEGANITGATASQVICTGPSPIFPTGLLLNPDCSITGTPAQSSVGFDYIIYATYNGVTLEVKINITINSSSSTGAGI
ncbi:MAG: putative Ig domain-containing protein [Leptospiraceae bacterium]|nr:putative Ig domain-containing protein [Leptospiraceae bacterium]